MSKIKGIVEWFETCPLVEEAGYVDVNQLNPETEALGIYKQPAVTVEELMDGSKLITENYYLLFRRAAQLKEDRFDNEDYLDDVEDWFEEQLYQENYPDIGFRVHDIAMSNAFYMLERDSEDAVYQLTISIQYEREVKK